MSKNKKSNVNIQVRDDYKFTHTRTTKTTFTDSNNQRHSVINKEVKTATQSKSYQPQQLSLTQGSSGGGYNKSISGPRDRSTFTHTSKTTYKGPNNQSVTHHDRNFHSSIQRQTFNPPSRNMIGYGHSNNYYYDSD